RGGATQRGLPFASSFGRTRDLCSGQDRPRSRWATTSELPSASRVPTQRLTHHDKITTGRSVAGRSWAWRLSENLAIACDECRAEFQQHDRDGDGRSGGHPGDGDCGDADGEDDECRQPEVPILAN